MKLRDWRPLGYWSMVLRLAWAFQDAKPGLGGDLAFWAAVHTVDQRLAPQYDLPGFGPKILETPCTTPAAC